MAKRKSWALRIDAAEKRGRFTKQEVKWARDNWCTCAVGEHRGFPALMNWDWGPDWGPDGSEEGEYKMGYAFGYAVMANNFAEARRLYEAIMALPIDG